MRENLCSTAYHRKHTPTNKHSSHPNNAPKTRQRSWVALRRKPPSERKVAVLLYGFPPGVGATGTAALLNVPKSLEAVLRALRDAGYDLGPKLSPELAAASGSGSGSSSGGGGDEGAVDIDGEAIVAALKAFEEGRVVAGGARAVEARGAGAAAAFGAEARGVEVTPQRLKEMLSFPKDWGPTEWGERVHTHNKGGGVCAGRCFCGVCLPRRACRARALSFCLC